MATLPIPKRISINELFYNSLTKSPEGERVRACLQCGTCSGVCPFGYLMDHPPGKMIAALRAGAFERVLQGDTLWMCVSCYACTQVCPSKIPLTPGLMTRAKEELVLAGNIPSELQDALENTHRYGNPLGESPRRRGVWTRGVEPPVRVMSQVQGPVDALWFVGDYASYHPRVQFVSLAFAQVLNALGVDYAILGSEENSDGDSQRLAGERGLFEMLVEKNSRTFGKYSFKEIITTDPHAYNALKHEYPSLGVTYPVRHYTQYLAERIDQLKPLLRREIKAQVTFHDPCYLGRANGEYEAPRLLLKAIPGVNLVEMAHNKETSLCCGGGGGGMWLDGFTWEKAHVRLSEWRVREAVNAGASVLAVACTYEAPRFEDAVKMIEKARRLVVRDIAELLAESILG